MMLQLQRTTHAGVFQVSQGTYIFCVKSLSVLCDVVVVHRVCDAVAYNPQITLVVTLVAALVVASEVTW